MVTLYLIRHGETTYNKRGVIQGSRIDTPLDIKGKKQILKTVKKLKERDHFEVIFSSTLKRARESAHIIKKYFRIKIIYSSDLVERDFGNLTGKTWLEIEKLTGKNLHRIDKSLNYNYRPYRGESVEDVDDRARRFLKEVNQKYKNKKVIVVTHAGFIRQLYKIFGRKKIPHEIGNGALHIFRYRSIP